MSSRSRSPRSGRARTSPSPKAAAVTEESQRWPTSRVRQLALAVGLLQTTLVTWVVWTSGYLNDDYLFLSLARKGGFSGTQLTRSVYGSVIPGFQLGNSLLASLHPLPRWPAVVIPVVLYALALTVFYRLAELLFGPRPILIPLMAVAGLSGVLATSLVWWTAGLNSLPALVFDLLALDGLVRHAATGKRRHLVVSVISFALGIAFYDASASFLAVLVVFTAVYLVDHRDWRAFLRGLTRRGWLWAAYAVPIALNLLWRSLHPKEYVLSPLPSVETALRFIGSGWAQGFVLSSFGITFSKLSQGWPRVLLVVVGQCLFFGLVAATIYRRRAAWKAWAVFGSGFLAIEVLAAVGRGGYGNVFAINTVYWTVQPFMLSLAVGLAFLPSTLGIAAPSPQKASRRPIPKVSVNRELAVIGATVVALCGSGVAAFWTANFRSQGATNHTFVENLGRSWNRVQAQSPHPFIWNTEVPGVIISPLFTPYNRVATTAGLLIDLRVDSIRGTGYLVSDDGNLVPASVNVVSRASLGRRTSCFSPRTRSRTASVALNAVVPDGNWFLRVSYSRSSGFSTTVDGAPVHFAKGSGGFLTPDSADIGKSTFSIKVPAEASACLTAAAVEAPVARPG